jgi:hypothetical protein
VSETPAVMERSGDVAAAEERGRGEALRARLAAVAVGGLHLAVLSSFALAQPLFDLLGKTPEFFAVRGSSPGEIVLFALAVAIGVPAALVLVELLVAVLAGWLVARAAHLLLVGGLFALFALQLLKRVEPSSGRLLVALAVVAGALFAAAYARARPVRAIVTVLGPAPLLFLGLFLFGSSVTKLVFPDDASAAVSVVAAKGETPVVVIVFDEFTSTSLLDRRGRVDAGRFPNFAALARTSTWYPDAMAVSQGTVRALPAILSGKDSGPTSLPTFQDHPQNLFTLLGRSHAVHALEPVTRLCPPELCPRPDAPSLRDELDTLGSDLGVVYLHLLLPRDLARDLPPITRAWGNFRETGRPRTFKERQFSEPAWAYDRFLERLASRSRRPPLHFAHINLPHVPYQYLPSGRIYSGDLFGLEAERWDEQRWPAFQAHQRYLLQVGYVDRLLGRALARLRKTGLFDRAVLVVTADHGVSFHAGEPRRTVTERTLADIAFVPLFVKSPGQQTGRTVRGVVRSVDILPTVAEHAGVAAPWKTDGQPLGGRSSGTTVRIDGKTFGKRDAFAARAAALERQRRQFGEGSWSGVFAAGPYPELLGRRLATLRIAPDPQVQATLSGEHAFNAVDPRGPLSPSLLVGTLSQKRGGAGAAARRTIAVALNGRIAAVSESYRYEGKTQFSALVPESAFSRGPDRVDVLAVSGRGSKLRITSLGGAGSQGTYRLVRTGARISIRTPSGETIRVQPGAVSGYVDIARVEGDLVNFFGWAADVPRKRIRDRVLVFANGRFVYAVDRPLEGRRPDLGAELEDAGFAIYLDRRDVLRGPNPELRVFAVVGGVASELRYPDGYRWGPG